MDIQGARDEMQRKMREWMMAPGSDVWIRVYGPDGRELFPEPKRVAVPADFLETGVLPLGLRIKRFVRWVAAWRTPDAGAGVHIDAADKSDGFIAAAYMYERTPSASAGFGDGNVCTVDELRFALV